MKKPTRPSKVVLKNVVKPDHYYVRLANHIDWKWLSRELGIAFSRSHDAQINRVPLRLMAGYAIARFKFSLSHEIFENHFVDSPYLQYLCGLPEFVWKLPLESAQLLKCWKYMEQQGLLQLCEEAVQRSKTLLDKLFEYDHLAPREKIFFRIYEKIAASKPGSTVDVSALAKTAKISSSELTEALIRRGWWVLVPRKVKDTGVVTGARIIQDDRAQDYHWNRWIFEYSRDADFRDLQKGKYGYWEIVLLPAPRNAIKLRIFQKSTHLAPTQLERCDRVVSSQGSLKHLLANPVMLDSYFTSLQAYYGIGRFQRKSFDAVISQLRRMVEEVPVLAQRLWETDDLGRPFSINPQSRAYGRDVNIKQWNIYLDEWKNRLHAESGQCAGRSLQQVREIYVRKLSEVAAQVAAAEMQWMGLGAKARREASGVFYLKLKQDSELNSMAACLLHNYLLSGEVQLRLGSTYADQVLASMDELRHSPAEIMYYSGIADYPGIFLSLIKQRVPRIKSLLNDADLFPLVHRDTHRGRALVGGVRLSRYRFVPLPRRLHGIWKGVPWHDCVGGGIGHLQNLTPKRWATIALAGTHHYNIERGSCYLGYIHVVPVVHRGRKFASLEIATTVLSNQILVLDPGTQEVSRQGIFEIWLKHKSVNRASDCEGFIIGHSEGMNYLGTLSYLRYTQAYLQGQCIGHSNYVALPDLLAHKIVEASRALGYKLPEMDKFTNNMVLDVTMRDAQLLVMLNHAPRAEKIAVCEWPLTGKQDSNGQGEFCDEDEIPSEQGARSNH